MRFIIEVTDHRKDILEDNLCLGCKLRQPCFIEKKANEIQERMQTFSVRVTECCAREIIGNIDVEI